jgi:hypothetical protein
MGATLVLAACGQAATNGKPAYDQTFVVDLADNQSARDIEAAAESLFTAVVSVEPLFPEADRADDPFGLSRVYRVRVTGEGPEGGPWDDAYALRDAAGFPRVEPDQQATFEPTTNRNAAALGCFDTPAGPSDRGWSLREIDLAEARLLNPPAGGKRLGEGVRICHPDTGWTEHVDLDASQIDKRRGLNLIDGGNNTKDPLGYVGHPGHGTGTGSVLISSGELTDTGTAPPGEVVGLAPKATLVPIRAIKSVVQVFDSDIARAVNHAVTAQCDVISMSLGGRGFFGLERALKQAVSHDIIVVAAAGNCVDIIVAPASYANSIAVAATNIDRTPWKGSSKGSAIDISAPGERVYVAEASAGAGPHNKVKAGNGTSYATTAIAGSAAVWLAFYGRDAIDRAKRGRTRQAVFLNALRESAENPCEPGRASCTWQSNRFGPGILNLEKLLRLDPAASAPTLMVPGSDDPVSILARMFDSDAGSVRNAVNELLGRPTDLDAELQRLGPELIDLAARNPPAFSALLPPRPDAIEAPQPRDTAVEAIRTNASRQLATLIPPAN